MSDVVSDIATPGRSVCLRCTRPVSVCVCAQVPHLPTTNTNVVLLQHPRESRKGIGTARLAHLSLPGSLLKAGLDFAHDAEVQAAVLGGPPAYVLFPGEDAIAIDELPIDRRITLVVVDGTWWQAKKLIKLNPWLAALPRVAFSPRVPSDYRIRRQPAAHCVSTIEALAEVLCLREPAGLAFDQLRDPFRAMVDLQIRFKNEVASSRHRGRVRTRDRRQVTLPEKLETLWPRLVFVQGEANAFPARAADRPPPALVHVVAQRAEQPEGVSEAGFEAILAPRGPLAPSTCRYVELAPERVLAGEALESAQARWQAFLRPDDVLCAWGPYHIGLALTEGWRLPQGGMGSLLDMRNALSQHLKLRLSLVDDGLAALQLNGDSSAKPGRAHRRLLSLVSLACQVRCSD